MLSMKKLALALSAAGLIVAAGSGPALAANWYRTPVPSSARTQLSVSCWSSSGCLSVGGTAMRWNGTAWKAIIKPTGLLKSVACTSATFCLAVGQNNYERAATWKWNGSGWKSLTTYNPASTDNVLYAVKCASATSCEAVGAHGYGSNDRTWPLAEHWNGTSWSHQSTTGAPHGALHGVSCESSSACEAVGANFDPVSTGCTSPDACPVAPTTLAMGWKSGRAWVTQATPLQPFMTAVNDNAPGSGWQDTGVSCWASGCRAVGWQFIASGGSDDPNQQYSETWDGTSWKLDEYGMDCASNPNCGGSDGSGLSAIHCSTASACVAAGWFNYGDAGGTTMAATWNGSKWIPASSPIPSANAAALFGLSCISGVSHCVAVGGGGQYGSPYLTDPAYAIRN